MRTLAKAFKKFGQDLGVNVKKDLRIAFVDISYQKAISIANIGAKTQEPLKSIDSVWNSKFTKSKLNAACVICGSEIGIEMHHVRKIRDLNNPNNKKDFFTRQMAAINRKQIPLCKDHHTRLHNET
jgi:hypothetical protein